MLLSATMNHSQSCRAYRQSTIFPIPDLHLKSIEPPHAPRNDIIGRLDYRTARVRRSTEAKCAILNSSGQY